MNTEKTKPQGFFTPNTVLHKFQAWELQKVQNSKAETLDFHTKSKSNPTEETSAWPWLGAGGLFIALGRPTRNFLHVMPKTEQETLSEVSTGKPADLRVFAHCAPLLLSLGKNPSKFDPVWERIRKGSREKNIPPNKSKQKSIFENQCQCVGFCSSWIQIHIISPAINILNLGPKTVCLGPRKFSIWLLQQRMAFMSNFAQKSRFGEFFSEERLNLS